MDEHLQRPYNDQDMISDETMQFLLGTNDIMDITSQSLDVDQLLPSGDEVSELSGDEVSELSDEEDLPEPPKWNTLQPVALNGKARAMETLRQKRENDYEESNSSDYDSSSSSSSSEETSSDSDDSGFNSQWTISQTEPKGFPRHMDLVSFKMRIRRLNVSQRQAAMSSVRDLEKARQSNMRARCWLSKTEEERSRIRKQRAEYSRKRRLQMKLNPEFYEWQQEQRRKWIKTNPPYKGSMKRSNFNRTYFFRSKCTKDCCLKDFLLPKHLR